MPSHSTSPAATFSATVNSTDFVFKLGTTVAGDDTAIEKIADVSSSLHTIMAVHEEKLARQEEAIFEAEQQIEVRRTEVLKQITELHSRITTNTKEIMNAAAVQHSQQNKEIQKIRDELVSRVGVLEKWRHVLIGGSIVIGFLLHKLIIF